MNQIEQFLQRSETPLTSIRKDDLLEQLKSQKTFLLDHPSDLLSLKQVICQECQPTYFNLMKAMYPLLADAYALNQAIYGNEMEAGRKIGLFEMPLEEVIKWAYASGFSPNSPAMHLTQKLEQQILDIQDPAFFGHWK